MKRDASSNLAFVLRNQQTSVGRRIVSRQSRQLLIEALEAQAEAQRLCVFQKKLAHLCNLRWRGSLRHAKSSNAVALVGFGHLYSRSAGVSPALELAPIAAFVQQPMPAKCRRYLLCLTPSACRH